MKKTLALSILTVCSLWSIICYAQSVPITNGAAWLTANQNADGSWGAQADLSLVYSAEAIDALKNVNPSGSAYSAGMNWLGLQETTATDELTHKIYSLINAGSNITALVTELLNYKNADGGWGNKSGLESNPLDTAFALHALKAANYSDTTVLYQAIHYLSTNQNSDGGWGFRPATATNLAGPSNASTTATVLRTFSEYNSVFINQDSINKASAFLLAHQNTDGGFGSSPSNVYETALSVMSLIESGKGGIQTIQNGINYLTLSQLADGSWNDDPYSTALALQALAEARPNLAVLSSGITFSNSMPQSGATTTISGVIRNTGYDNASNVLIRFYLGDPAVGGTQIGTDQIIPFIALGSSAQASITASFTGTGGKTIFVVADPDNAISETSEADNKAF